MVRDGEPFFFDRFSIGIVFISHCHAIQFGRILHIVGWVTPLDLRHLPEVVLELLIHLLRSRHHLRETQLVLIDAL